MPYRRCSVLVLLVLAFVCCTLRVGAGETKVRIVTLGDSITLGARQGVRPEETFAALVEAELRKRGVDAEVINEGVGGERSDQALARLDKAVIAKRPKIVTVMYGTNDSYVDEGQKDSRISVEMYRANLQKIVARLKEAGIQTILMTEPRWGSGARKNGLDEHPNERLTRYMDACREVAHKTGTPLVDHFAHWTRCQKEQNIDLDGWTTDSCHPNPRGHRELARSLMGKLFESLGVEDKTNP